MGHAMMRGRELGEKAHDKGSRPKGDSPFSRARPKGNAPGQQVNYTDVYNRLDQHKYHNPNFAFEVGLVPHLRKAVQTTDSGGKRTRVISLGCSTGLGVQALAKAGFDAYGVDVSPGSIQIAESLHRHHLCSEQPCLVSSSLTKLPYSTAQFKAGISADVLEHLTPSDVPAAVAEISRVVSGVLLLRISIVPESRKMYLDGVEQVLHLTVQPPTWWEAQFATAGWKNMGRKIQYPAHTSTSAFLALCKGDDCPSGVTRWSLIW